MMSLLMSDIKESCCTGDLESLMTCLRDEQHVNKVYNYKWTLLHFAAHHGHLEIVECLVQHGANIEACNSKGKTPVAIASQEGYLDIVKYLMRRGANMDVVTKFGYTIMALVVYKVFATVHYYKDELMSDDEDWDPESYRTIVNWKSARGRLDVLLVLISMNISIDDLSMNFDESGRLSEINDCIHHGGNMLSHEEKNFMRKLAYMNAVKFPGIARKMYYIFYSYITYRGIFMSHGYGLGDESLWNKWV